MNCEDYSGVIVAQSDWGADITRALLIQSDCVLILCQPVDWQGRERFFVISVSLYLLWCVSVCVCVLAGVCAYFTEWKQKPGGEKGVWDEWLYRGLLCVCAVHVCNHVFGSVCGLAQPVYWPIDGPYHAVPYRSSLSHAVWGNQFLHLLYIYSTFESWPLCCHASPAPLTYPLTLPLDFLFPLPAAPLLLFPAGVGWQAAVGRARTLLLLADAKWRVSVLSSSDNIAKNSSWFTFICRKANNVQVQVHMPHAHILSPVIDSAWPLPVWGDFSRLYCLQRWQKLRVVLNLMETRRGPLTN